MKLHAVGAAPLYLIGDAVGAYGLYTGVQQYLVHS